MCAIGRLALLTLLFASTARADDDAPAIFQSAPNFSNAIAGSGFAISWWALPTELDDEDTIHLEITFLGATNPERIRRPALRERPAFKAAFREILDEEPTNAPNAVTFHYKLRPRGVAVKELPELAVAYYAPGSATVATKYLDAIPIVVKPADASPPQRPLDAPERFFAWPTTGTGFRPGLAAWASLANGLIFLALLGLAIERFRNPDGVRLARLRRIRAVRTALDALDRAARSPDPAGAALEALRHYLAVRHGAVAPTATPGDFVRALEALSFAPERIEYVRNLASAGDAERFAPIRASADLVPRVRRMILDWEDAA